MTFYGNTATQWGIALGVTFGVWAVLKVVVSLLVGRVGKLTGKTKSHLDDVLVAALGHTKGLLLAVFGAFFGSGALSLSAGDRALIKSVTVVALLIQGGIWATAGIRKWVELEGERRLQEDAAAVMTMNVLGIAVRIAVWSLVLLLALDNIGVDVTALVTGLGIGGVAVALALQNVLGDLLGSLSIVLDKPFVLGDFLIIGDFLGTVESIGLKTTRVRSLSGEEVVFSNSDLLTSRIRNYGRMFQRRIVFSIGVTYQTPRDKLRAIPGMIREAIEAHGDNVRFDRAHMKSYGDFAIVFEAVYFVLKPDYILYMDIQQDINLRIHEDFENEGIEFAYPTQTIFVAKEE